jgi:branched-chain amino acid transport system permease protein
LAAVVLALATDFVADNWLNPRYALLLLYIALNVILVVGLNLINGFAGQFSLGHAGFMAVGAYVSAALTAFQGEAILGALTFLPDGVANAVLLNVALVLGGVAAAVLGLLVGLPTLRLRGDYLAIATLGFGEMVRIVILNLEVVGGATGFGGFPKLTTLFWALVWVWITVAVVKNLVLTVHGRALLAIREDEIAAESVGINTTFYKVAAFAIGAFFAGVAGGLFAHFLLYINPASFDFLKSVELVVMVVLGGMGSLTGSVVAAVVLTVLREYLRVLGAYRLVIYAALLVTMMLIRPSGLLGGKELSWRAIQVRWQRLFGRGAAGRGGSAAA